MAFIDIHYGYSINGVAAIHTEILEKSELKDFYQIYPEKFNNKTNGITFRRWLLSCNHPLADLISGKIGDAYKKNADRLEELMEYMEDEAFLSSLETIKMDKKKELAAYLKEKENVEVDPESIFDIQVKRLHAGSRWRTERIVLRHKPFAFC